MYSQLRKSRSCVRALLLVAGMAAAGAGGCGKPAEESERPASSNPFRTTLRLSLPREARAQAVSGDLKCVVVRVTASDLDVPVQLQQLVAPGQLAAGSDPVGLQLDVPAGLARNFAVEAYVDDLPCRETPTNLNGLVFTGEQTADVPPAGTTVTLRLAPPAALVLRRPGSETTTKGSGASLQLLAGHQGTEPVSFQAQGLPRGLQVDPTTGRITGTVDPLAAEGPYDVTVTATSGVETVQSTFRWTVADPPVSGVGVSPSSPVALNEGIAAEIRVLASDDDPLTYTAVGLPPGLTIDATTGVISGRPSQGAAAASPYTVTATASEVGASDSAVFTVTVTNLAPVAMNDAGGTSENAAVILAVLTNDTNSDTDTIDSTSVTIATSPQHGTAASNPDGTITYTPAARFFGTDSFTYTVRDTQGVVSTPATVAVRVNGLPVAQDDSATTGVSTPVTVAVLANDTDPDGAVNPSTVALVGFPTKGTASPNPDGTVTYTPTSGTPGLDNFTYTIRDDAGVASNAATVTVDVQPGPAAQLVFGGQPVDTVAGAAIAPPVTVFIQDEFGNTAVSATDSVTLSIQPDPGAGNVAGSLTVSAVAGVATFSDLRIQTAGSYTLQASSGTLSKTSAPFAITAAQASQLVFASQPSNTSAGAAVAPAVQVSVLDAFGNTVTSSASPIALAVQPDPGAGNSSGTFTVNAAAGVATFSDLVINKAGSYTLQASSGSVSRASTGFQVVPGAPAGLVFVTQPSDATAGVTIAPAVAVSIQDSFGNLASGATNPVTIAVQPDPGKSNVSGTLTVDAAGGIAVFSDLAIGKTGSYTLQASSETVPVSGSVAFVISDLRVTSFTAAKSRAQVGEQLSLSWTLSGVPAKIEVEPGPLDVTGLTSTAVTPFPAPPAGADPRAFFKVRATTPAIADERAEFAFARQVGGTGAFCRVSGIASLDDGGAVITGFFSNTVTFGPGEAGATTLSAFGFEDIFVARYNRDGTLAWAKRAGGTSSDSGSAVAAFPSGGVLITGSFGGTATFGAGEARATTLAATGFGDLFVARYDPDGTLAWAVRAGGTSSSAWGAGISVFPDGSAVVSGGFTASATFGVGEVGEAILNAAGSSDIFVARYNSDGTLDWAAQAGGSLSDEGAGVAAFADGSSVVTGFFDGTAMFGASETRATALTTAGGRDVFVARYNPDGTLAWAKRSGGTSADGGAGIAALADGGAVIAGSFSGTASFGLGEAQATAMTSAGGDDIFVARYNPDGTLSWAKRAGGSSSDQGSAVAVFPDGSSVITGVFDGSAIFGAGDANAVTLTAAGTGDIFVARYHASGTLAWVEQAGGDATGEGPTDTGNGIAALPDGTAVICGSFEGAATFGAGGAQAATLVAAGSADIFIARYDPVNYRILEVRPAGLSFVNRAGSAAGSAEIGRGVSALPDGGLCATGFFSGTASFGAGASLTAQADDIFLARYASNGTLAWVRKAGGANSDAGFGAAAAPDGGCFTAGLFRGSAVFGAGEATQTTLTAAGPSPAPDIFVARYGADGAFQWAAQEGSTDAGLFSDVAFDVAALPGDGAVSAGQYTTSVILGAGTISGTFALVNWFDSGESLLGRSGGNFSQEAVATSVSTFPDGGVAVTGRFTGGASFDTGIEGSVPVTSAGDSDVFVARYLADGTLAWLKRAGGLLFDAGYGVTALPDGGVLVSGVFAGTATFGPGEPGQTTLAAAGENLFLARYRPDGTLALVRRIDASRANSGVFIRVAAFPDGSFVVAGSFAGTATFGPGEARQTVLTAFGTEDLFVARFDSNGSLTDVRHAGGSGVAAEAFDVTAFSDGSAAVTGWFSGMVTFGPGEANQKVLTASGQSDIFVLKYFPF